MGPSMITNRRRIFQNGRTYHITHRCHNRQFNLRFSLDRDNYLRRMWEAKRRYDVSVFDYIITSNHVHILLSAMDGGQISGFMQYISSLSARDFNRRKEMTGANLLVLCAINTHKNAIIMKLLLTVKSYFICLI